jgi:hypothetical protein
MIAIEKALGHYPGEAWSLRSAMKSEARNSKPETISKSEYQNPAHRARLEIRDSNSFRISTFAFWISIPLPESSGEIDE